MTAYNAVTPIEVEASRRLVEAPAEVARRQADGTGDVGRVRARRRSRRRSGPRMARDRTRPMILATRFGFHGKKGLANAVTGSETDAERDPRVRFITFPMAECRDVSMRDAPFDPTPYQKELDALLHQFGRKIGTLITEPYLGGGGSYHPPKAYLQLLERFCRDNDIVFILDEVQANFGRTGAMFAFETYGLEPDIVVLGKGLGNGVPVAAAVGRADLFAALDYGEGSDTWSANPLCCAAVLATLDEFARPRRARRQMKASLGDRSRRAGRAEGVPVRRQRPRRGRRDGLGRGDARTTPGRTAAEWANAFVLACYHGDGRTARRHPPARAALEEGGPRSPPPLVITQDEATAAVSILNRPPLAEPAPPFAE